MLIKVIHTKRSPNLPNTVYVGRPTILGNPFSHLSNTLAKHRTATVEEAVAKYKVWLLDNLDNNQAVIDAMNEILDLVMTKDVVHLACWCKDEVNPYDRAHACHAEVIREVILNHLEESED